MSNVNFEAALFDMDGVLFDSEALHMKAWQIILKDRGLDYDLKFFDDWIGVPDKDLGDFLEDLHPGISGERSFLMRKLDCFRELVSLELNAYEGLVEKLRELSACMKVALATSSRRFDRDHMLEVTGLEKFFKVSCCYDDVVQHKPHPAPYLKVASELGACPRNCVVIEDSPSGVKAGLAAGMTVLGVRTSFNNSQLGAAHRFFDTTAEACDWILAESCVGGKK